MKKLTYLLMSVFIISAIVSCSKEEANDNELDLLKKATALVAPTTSNPKSVGQIYPYIIPGANNGGNRTCDEVAAAFPESNPFYCDNKIDYNNGAFAGEFPSGLDVTVTYGKYVSFEMDDCIQFGDKFYRVGAVIVKGSNAANVYFYPDGTMGDSGLASPINASGNPAGLSNLTFCFVECEQESIIAIKVWYKEEGSNSLLWGVSTGTYIFTGGTWCAEGPLGINSYPTTPFIHIEKARTDIVIGGATIVNNIVEITLNEGLILDKAYIFIGTQEELTDPENLASGCPDYENAPWTIYVAPTE